MQNPKGLTYSKQGSIVETITVINAFDLLLVTSGTGPDDGAKAAMKPETDAAVTLKRYPFTEQLRFERLISEMATGFVNLPIDQIDQEIHNTLHLVSKYFAVDRSTIFALSNPPHTLEVVHAYTLEGIDPAAGLDAQKRYPWCWRKLQRGERIAISSREELPGEAAIDQENMKQTGIKSFIGIPVRIRGNFRFVFTLTCLRRPHRWDPNLLNRIQLVGQLLGNALHRKEMETELAALIMESHQFQNEISRRYRIGTIGALTAAIAHEINQPLTAILSNAQAALHFLERSPPAMEEIRPILQDIVLDNKRASEVISNVRSLLKENVPHNAPFHINELVSKAIHIIRGEAILRSIGITEDLTSDLPPAFGDPILIQQVLLNLLINAMEAMTSMEGKTAWITVQTRLDLTGWIDVHVCDTGPGIDETMKNAIFKNLYTSKPDGLGIGLILCRSIIEAHGGTMSAENLPEGGARFSFRLPAQN